MPGDLTPKLGQLITGVLRVLFWVVWVGLASLGEAGRGRNQQTEQALNR